MIGSEIRSQLWLKRSPALLENFPSIGHTFLSVANAHAAFPVILRQDEVTTYAKLHAMTVILADRFLADGVGQNSIVAVSNITDRSTICRGEQNSRDMQRHYADTSIQDLRRRGGEN
jgi:hypothetical protein